MLLLLSAALLTVLGAVRAQTNREVLGLRPTGVTGELRVLSKPDGNSGPLKLWYRFGPNDHCPECEAVVFQVRDLGGVGYSGPMEWKLPATLEKPAEGVMELEIPPNDTCKLEVNVTAPCPSGMILVYFVSTGDTIEFHQGKIRAADQRSSNEKRADLWESILSRQQLDYEYEIEVSLGYGGRPGSRERKAVEELLGPVTPSEHAGMYLAKATRREMLQLLRRNIGFRIMSDEYPDVKHIMDSVRAASPPPQERQKSSKPVGYYPHVESDSLRSLIDSVKKALEAEDSTGGSSSH